MNAPPEIGPDGPNPTVEGAGPSTVLPEGQPATEIELWEPRSIGWTSIILGYPGAIVISALNWLRLGRARKAIVHLAAAVIGTWALIFGNVGLSGLLVGVVVGYYLFRVQRSDQAALIAAGRVKVRSGLVGAVIALGGTLLIVGSGVLIADAAGVGEIPHRGEVLFGTHRVADICAPAGQTTVFGQADRIYLTAIMRETVRPGSHVVVEIDGPGVKEGPFPVSVQPPFDCLGGGEPVGGLNPGIYVVRYRYEGRPGTPDLATGSFTVRPSPAGS